MPIQNHISEHILQKTRAGHTLIVLELVLDIFRFIFPSGKYRLCFDPQLFLESLVLYCWIAQISKQGSNVQVSSISWLHTFGTFPSGRNFDCFDLFCCNSAGVGDDYGVEKICRTQASSDGSTKAVSVTRRVSSMRGGIKDAHSLPYCANLSVLLLFSQLLDKLYNFISRQL